MTDGERPWVYFFGDNAETVDGPDKELLGGKGASLAAMSRAGLPVPPGFTISTTCCRRFHENGRWPDGLEDQVRQHLSRLEEVMGRRFGRGSSPLLVSVRSGAAVSMPGMMDTILNCGLHPALASEVGDTASFWRVYLQFIVAFASTVANLPPEVFCPDDSSSSATPSRETVEAYLRVYEQHARRPFPVEPWELLRECIDAVFRSWNGDRAVAYRRQHDIHGLQGTAVNVQAMFPSQVSGVLFTQDPNNLSAEQMVLESSYGLGEAVVSGEVSPDRFVIGRQDLQLLKTVVGNKCHVVSAAGDEETQAANELSFSADQVAEICRLGLRVEAQFGAPMDIEWGWADGEFCLLQCRPIRGLDVARDAEVGRQAEVERLRSLSAGRRQVWVQHNLAETLRAPTPLTWDIVRRFMSGDGGFGQLYRDLGYRPSPEVCRQGFLELIGQRIYADPERVAQLFWGRGPLTYDLEALKQDPGLLDRAPLKFDPEKADGMFFLRLPGMILSMFRASRIARHMSATAKRVFDNDVLPAFLNYVAQQRDRDLAGLNTAEVIAELHERSRKVLDEFGKESLKPGFFGGVAFSELQVLLVRLLGPEKGVQTACRLTMGLEGDTTVEQNQSLYRVARGEIPMQEFQDQYGHRTFNEMELAEPRWREDVQQLDSVLRTMRTSVRSPLEIHQEHAAERSRLEAELPGVLAQWGGSSFREELQGKLRQAQSLLGYRESAKHFLMMGYELLRLAIMVLARRWDLGRDVFFLQLDELESFEQDRSRLEDIIAGRKLRWQSLQRLDMPRVIDSENLDGLGLPQEYDGADRLDGDPIAAGAATGTARLVFDPRQTRDLGRDYILVCPSTDPSWTVLFVEARGLVVERGGMLSHGAIVARDFGIPAVVCAGATRRIRDGDRLQVDGNRGEIHILRGGAHADDTER